MVKFDKKFIASHLVTDKKEEYHISLLVDRKESGIQFIIKDEKTDEKYGFYLEDSDIPALRKEINKKVKKHV